jgi:pyrroloquinoline-quinone synthase
MEAKVAQVLEAVCFEENPYFVALRGRSFDRADFLETQRQFYFAVEHFSRPMAVLSARLPGRGRASVVRNVWEELGSDGAALAHEASFRTLLARLGDAGAEQAAQRPRWPEVAAFNAALDGVSALGDHRVGVAMFGLIERQFADISAWIGRAIVEAGWLSAEQMIHYALHEELDIQHAADFFDIIAPLWGRSEEDQAAITEGLWLGAAVFYQLYEGLYRGRRRRWSSPAVG